MLPLLYIPGISEILAALSNILNSINGVTNTIANLPSRIIDALFSFIVNGLVTSSQAVIDACFKFLFSSPSLQWFCSQFNTIMTLLEGLFSIALMGVALYFILKSSDVEGRVFAKKWMEKLLVMIAFLSFAFPLFQIMINFNTDFSTQIASESMKSLFHIQGNFSSLFFAFLMLSSIMIFVLLTFITLLVRYILIPFLLLLFPISIFLYFLPFTESWGKALLKIIVSIVFMPILDALILFGLAALFNSPDPNLADPLIRSFALLLGFGAIGLVNLWLFISAGLSVVSQSKAVSALIGVTILGKVLKR